MNKATANQIAKLWNANFVGFTKETMTEAKVTSRCGNRPRRRK